MKRAIQLFLIITVILLASQTGNAQCKTFAKKVCMKQLIPYVHDGIYNATILSEGETAELFKTFYSGQEYRIVVCGDEELPVITFQLLDAQRNILFDSKEHNNTNYFDFKLEASQQLIIILEVQTTEELSERIPNGCVAVMVGFMNVEDEFITD